MSSLHVIKGANPGAVIDLTGDRMILGRNPECAIVIPITSVSREHAQILKIHGKYFIEDLNSRNKTFVNNQEITTRTQLKHNDRIRICDFVATFHESPDGPGEEEEDAANTTVEATLSHSSNLLWETQPAEKLRGILEISNNLAKTLQLDQLLPKIVDSLFSLFKQADRGFIILADADNAKLMPKVVKTRRAQDESNARFSRSIVRRCLETAQAFLSDDATQDDRVQLSQSVVDFRIRSVMCVPLCNAEEKAFGVIQLDTQDRSKKFTKPDLELLCGVSNQAAIALENARLLQAAVDQARIQRDLEVAREVQLSFLPQQLPQVEGYEFWADYEPANEVGGDYYDFIPLSSGRLAMTLGDVAGKGVPAALLMGRVATEARFHFLIQPDPARAVSGLNDSMSPQCSRMDRFVTFAAAVLDPATHTVTLVNAGHLSPLHYCHADRTWTECVPRRVSGLALGIMDGFAFESCTVALRPGDSILMFSDGVTESNNIKGEQFHTKERKGLDLALQNCGPGARSQIERLLRAVKQHSAGAKQNDDITVVALSRNV